MKETEKNKMAASFRELLDELSAERASTHAEAMRIVEATESYLPAHQPDVDAGWSRLKTRMQHEQARSKPMTAVRTRSRWWTAAAAAILLLTGVWGAITWWQPTTDNWVTVNTTDNQQQMLVLADGTTIRLNEKSSISYPMHFEGETRTVQLSGEAFFDVAKRTTQPFIITTAETNIRVLGTSFNVQTNRTTSQTTVSVKTGKVEVSDRTTNEKMVLLPYEKAIHQHHRHIQKVQDSDLQDLAWHTLDFRRASITNILQHVQRHYNIRVDAEQSQVLDCLQTIDFADLDLETTFAILKTSLGVTIEQTAADTYIMRGGNCTGVQ